MHVAYYFFMRLPKLDLEHYFESGRKSVFLSLFFYRMTRNEYIELHTDAEPDYLAHINRKTHLLVVNPRMISGHFQGRFLSMIAKMQQPTRILELGTFTGYSALCLAESLGETGRLHTIEENDELEDLIRENFAESPFEDKITLHIGPALDVIPTLDETFDLIFIDADKREYCAYYDAVFDKLRPGGLMLVDNTLWSDKVLETVQANDKQTVEILRFNDYVSNDARVEKLIVPLRDGLTMIRKK